MGQKRHFTCQIRAGRLVGSIHLQDDVVQENNTVGNFTAVDLAGALGAYGLKLVSNRAARWNSYLELATVLLTLPKQPLTLICIDYRVSPRRWVNLLLLFLFH